MLNSNSVNKYILFSSILLQMLISKVYIIHLLTGFEFYICWTGEPNCCSRSTVNECFVIRVFFYLVINISLGNIELGGPTFWTGQLLVCLLLTFELTSDLKRINVYNNCINIINTPLLQFQGTLITLQYNMINITFMQVTDKRNVYLNYSQIHVNCFAQCWYLWYCTHLYQ